MPVFPDFGDRRSKADVDPGGDDSHEQAEMYRQAYREGYASGYAFSRAVQQRRAAALFKVIERIAIEVKEHTARGLCDVKEKTSEIATVIAANIAANDIVAQTQQDRARADV
ncbi:MAG: hypothetical protein J7M12_05965 [Candidatus Hydrogenedentes bacterium]|nr:hypothetical protein [Candidatus Hydrogenedentota bacterium]